MLPVTVGIRDGVVQLVSILGGVVSKSRARTHRGLWSSRGARSSSGGRQGHPTNQLTAPLFFFR